MKIIPQDNYVLVEIEHPQVIVGQPAAHADTRYKIIATPESYINNLGKYIIMNSASPNPTNIRVDRDKMLVHLSNIAAFVEYE